MGVLRRLLLAVGLAAAAFALVVLALNYVDRYRLGSVAREVIARTTTRDQAALALLHWVCRNQGFEKNKSYFLMRGLGPTPVDVLEHGGDGADKSRLLAALLWEVEIPASPAICFDTAGLPTHIVVDAEIAPGKKMLLDPIWDLHFPKPDSSGYYSLLDLRRDPGILTRRLEALTATAAPNARLRAYDRKRDRYDLASTFDWEKNFGLRTVRDYLKGDLGEGVFAVRRPAVLEEPKLMVAVIFGCFSIGALLSALLLSVRAHRRQRRGTLQIAVKIR